MTSSYILGSPAGKAGRCLPAIEPMSVFLCSTAITEMTRSSYLRVGSTSVLQKSQASSFGLTRRREISIGKKQCAEEEVMLRGDDDQPAAWRGNAARAGTYRPGAPETGSNAFDRPCGVSTVPSIR